MEFENGVKREHLRPRYDLIPKEGLEELAIRFTQGAEKYGEYVWQGAGDDFFKDIPNHMVDHLWNYMNRIDNGEDNDIDNLAAVMWGCATLIWKIKNRKPTDTLHS